MCGRFNVTDDPYVHDLLRGLGIDMGPLPLRVYDDIAPTQTVSIIVDSGGVHRLCNATWWLLMAQTDHGFKPLSKYASFNTRSDKLNTPRSAGFVAYRETRCIIPASGFVETNPSASHSGKADKKGAAYSFVPEESAIAFGGLYREWVHPVTGERALSCSIITLPPHNATARFHPTSMPLILPNDPATQSLWLDATLNDTAVFAPLLTPRLPMDFRVTPIEKASVRTPVGMPTLLKRDDAA